MLNKITIDLHKAQNDFRNSTAVFRGFVGGRGSGKSFAGAYDLLRRAIPGKVYGLYAPTYPLLRDASLRSIISIGNSLHFIKSFNKGEMTIILGNGAEIICRSLDDPEHARGPNLWGAWMDEASLVDREAFDIVIACLRGDGQQGWLSATFTPKGKDHWTYNVFGEAKADTELFKSRTSENPFLPDEFEQRIGKFYTTQYARQELGGEFIDTEGTMCKAEWFKYVPDYPKDARLVRGWDFAATAKTSADFTVGALVGEKEGIFYVCDIQRRQITGGEVESLVKSIANSDGNKIAIALEQEPGASGKIASSSFVKSLSGYNVRAVPASGDKVTRAMPFLSQLEAGNVRIIRAPWNQDLMAEYCAFPNGMHDDQVDAISLAFNQLTANFIDPHVTVAEPAIRLESLEREIKELEKQLVPV